MELLFLLAVLWTGFVIYLFTERLRLDKYRRKIPIRIAVNGTRGKTGAVRMIAAALRANKLTVCCKTSGSETRFIRSDGCEERVGRFGPPSVIEQVRMLRKAAALGSDAVVFEIMGIQPEYQILESKRIIDPGYTLIVNARLDHEEQGNSEEEVMNNYLAAVPAGSRVFRDKGRARLILELCRSLGLDEWSSLKAMGGAGMDRGAFRVFRCANMDCCNLFAANDIKSTRILADSLPPGFRVGLFNSRRDRGGRSLQFIQALENGVFNDIKLFFIMGSAAAFFKRKLPGRTIPLKSKDPKKIMSTIKNTLSAMQVPDNSTVQILGMGNIKGAEALLEYWSRE